MKKYFSLPSAVYLAFSCITLLGSSSCVPLAIGAAGAAVGYIARDEGVGVADPASSSGSDNSYDSSDPAVY